MLSGEPMNHPNQQIACLHNRHIEHDLPTGDGLSQELLEQCRCTEGFLQALCGGNEARDWPLEGELIELGVFLREPHVALEASVEPVPEVVDALIGAIAVLGTETDRHQEEGV